MLTETNQQDAGNFVHFSAHFHQCVDVSFEGNSWIHLANNFHSNQLHYTSYEHHNLYMFVHVRIQP